MQHHERLTLGLSENAPRANPTTSQRLTLGLVENPESGNPTSKRLTRGPVENAPRANPATSPRLPPLCPLSPINIVHPSKGRRGSYL